MSYLLGVVSLFASTALSSSEYELVDCGSRLGGCTWKRAKKACENIGYGAGLALIRTKDEAERALQALEESNADSAWVGLVKGKMLSRITGNDYAKNEWKYADEADCDNADDMPFWAEGEPSYSGSCASIYVQSGGCDNMMKAEACNTQHEALCQKGGSDYGGSEETTTAPEDTEVQVAVQTPEPTPVPVQTSKPTFRPTSAKSQACAREDIIRNVDSTCTVHGDPHIITFQQQRVDQMGKPDNFYYFIAKCPDAPREAFPMQFLSYFRDYTGSGMTIVSYTVAELFMREGTKYFLWMENDGIWWAETKEGMLPQRKDHVATKVDPDAGNLCFGDGCQIEVEIEPFLNANIDIRRRRRLVDTDFLTSHRDYIVNFRDNINGGKIELQTNGHSWTRYHMSDEYKCNSCGLCGDFRNGGKSMTSGCGDLITYKSPFLFIFNIYKDLTAWGYQYQFYNNECGKKQIVTQVADKEEQCPTWLQRMTEKECAKWKLDSKAIKCSHKLKIDLKDRYWDCTVDACVLASKYIEDNGGRDKGSLVAKAAKEMFADEIYGECGLSAPAILLDTPTDNEPNDVLITFTSKTLTYLGLLLLNIVALVAIACFCRSRNSSKYTAIAPAKYLESDEEEEQQIIAAE